MCVMLHSQLCYPEVSRYSLHVKPVLPASADPIPLLWCCDNHISFFNSSDVRGGVSSELNNTFPQILLQPHLPVVNPLSHQRLQRCNIDSLAPWAAVEHPAGRETH